MMIMGIFQSIQWLIALIVALAVCLVFLFAIFFGAVALFDRETAAKMFQGFQESLPSWVPSLPTNCCSSSAQSSQAQRHEALHNEINGIQDNLTTNLDQLTARLEKLEEMNADMVNQQQLTDMNHEVQETVSTLQSSVEQTASQLLDISPENILGDLPQRLQTLEKQQAALEIPAAVDLNPLQDEIKTIQDELSQIKEQADKALETATGHTAASAVQEETPQQKQEEQEEHRIFSYFDTAADKEKLVALVTFTLDKDMSYKQVLNFLTKELGAEKGKIISSHPSLSKDYIRQCRKNRS